MKVTSPAASAKPKKNRPSGITSVSIQVLNWSSQADTGVSGLNPMAIATRPPAAATTSATNHIITGSSATSASSDPRHVVLDAALDSVVEEGDQHGAKEAQRQQPRIGAPRKIEIAARQQDQADDRESTTSRNSAFHCL